MKGFNSGKKEGRGRGETGSSQIWRSSGDAGLSNRLRGALRARKEGMACGGLGGWRDGEGKGKIDYGP